MEYMDFKKKDDRDVLQLERFPMEKGELPVLHYPLLDACGMVKHCFTTRGGGVSKGMFESLNLSFTRGDDEADVQENYARVASFFGTDKMQFVCSDQTHTTNVRRVGKADAGYGVTRPRPYKDVDGLVTDEPGIILSTFYADCVPLFFVDPVHRAIGLSHSGWWDVWELRHFWRWKENSTPDQRRCWPLWDRLSARIVMKSVRMWQMHFTKNFRVMRKKFYWTREMESISLICGKQMRSFCGRLVLQRSIWPVAFFTSRKPWKKGKSWGIYADYRVILRFS